MILVDTSVWIDYFNGRDTQETERLDQALGRERVLIGDLILLEILQGFRSDRDYQLAKEQLTELKIVEMLNQSRALKASEYYRALRKRGITIRKTVGVIIASYCIDNQIPLLFSGRDFLPFAEYLQLKTVPLTPH